MITIEHDWPPGLSPQNATTSLILAHTTMPAQAMCRAADALRMQLGHGFRDAGHYVVGVLKSPDNSWAARFLLSRGFSAEPLQEILEDHLTGRSGGRASEGLSAAGHQMFKQALQVTMARKRYPIDISEIIAGAFLSGSPIVKDMVLDRGVSQGELVNGLLISRSRN